MGTSLGQFFAIHFSQMFGSLVIGIEAKICAIGSSGYTGIISDSLLFIRELRLHIRHLFGVHFSLEMM